MTSLVITAYEELSAQKTSDKYRVRMRSLKPIRLSERVCELLKEMIQEGGFKPGDKFYSESQLIGRLRVSRSSVREAIRILEATGWVKVEHGRGIYVSGTGHAGLDAFTSWLRTNETDILEHFELRMMLDPRAAASAARNASAEDLRILERLWREFADHADRSPAEVLIKIDERFHDAIARSTKNRTLTVLMNAMTRDLSEGWISSLHVPDRIAKTVEEHGRILQAIRERRPEDAERFMVEHLNNALQEIRQLIAKGADRGPDRHPGG